LRSLKFILLLKPFHLILSKRQDQCI